MPQPPTRAEKVTKNLIIVTAILAVIGGAWLHGNRHGRITTENNYILAEKELSDRLDKKRREDAVLIANQEKQLKDQRRTADAQLRELLRKNKELQKWHDQLYPDSALDYAFGMQHTDSQ